MLAPGSDPKNDGQSSCNDKKLEALEGASQLKGSWLA